MESKKLIENILYVIKSQIEESRVRCDIENNVEICDERTFLGYDEDYKWEHRDTIFDIVKFEKGTISSGFVVQTATFEIVSEMETFDKARTLLNDFAMRFNFITNTGIDNDVYIQQSYTTVQMDEPFEEDGDNFRASLSINATYVYSESVSAITSVSVDSKNVFIVSSNYHLSISPNTANIGNNNGRTNTQNKFASFTMTCAIPSETTQNGELITKLDGFIFGATDLNTTFSVSFVKGGTTYTKTLKLLDADYTQNMGEVPLYAFSLGM